MGWSADDPVLIETREWILAHGGVTACNTFTKIYLCSLGQYEYNSVPAIPPEIVLFPNWFYFNIYEISSWSRAILVPLSIAYAKKPYKKIPPEQGISELFVGGRENADLHLKWDREHVVSWRNFFIFIDRMTHWFERIHIRPLRSMALKKAEKWMLERLEMSDGLGAIYPAMLNSIIALRCLGYSLDDPQVIRAMDEFEKLGIDEPQGTPDYPEPTFRMQPCMSPVWDTAQAVYALGEAGVDRRDPRLLQAADWMLSKEVRHKGDWAVKNRHAQPGGWYFEFNNEFYPDVDDTGQVLLALNKVDNPRERYQYDVCQRAIEWVFAMQCQNGGWASFDKDNTKMIFQHIPFADHNAMLDPPTVDITGRILEMLATYGYTRKDRRVEKAIKFIYEEQEADGSWFGRWGVNYLYGTFLVLRGPGGDGRVEPRAGDPAGGGVDSHGAERRWRLGRELRTATTIRRRAAWARARLRRRRGRFWDCWRPAIRGAIRWRRASDGCWRGSRRTAPGMRASARARRARRSTRGRDSRGCFIWRITLYRDYFPLLALTNYKRAMERAAEADRLEPNCICSSLRTEGEILNGGTCIAGVDGCNLRPEAEAEGRKRYPLVLMLEPLFRCNLACAGCGKIQYPAAHSEAGADAGGVLPRGGGVRARRWSRFPAESRCCIRR